MSLLFISYKSILTALCTFTQFSIYSCDLVSFCVSTPFSVYSCENAHISDLRNIKYGNVIRLYQIRNSNMGGWTNLINYSADNGIYIVVNGNKIGKWCSDVSEIQFMCCGLGWKYHYYYLCHFKKKNVKILITKNGNSSWIIFPRFYRIFKSKIRNKISAKLINNLFFNKEISKSIFKVYKLLSYDCFICYINFKQSKHILVDTRFQCFYFLVKQHLRFYNVRSHMYYCMNNKYIICLICISKISDGVYFIQIPFNIWILPISNSKFLKNHYNLKMGKFSIFYALRISSYEVKLLEKYLFYLPHRGLWNVQDTFATNGILFLKDLIDSNANENFISKIYLMCLNLKYYIRLERHLRTNSSPKAFSFSYNKRKSPISLFQKNSSLGPLHSLRPRNLRKFYGKILYAKKFNKTNKLNFYKDSYRSLLKYMSEMKQLDKKFRQSQWKQISINNFKLMPKVSERNMQIYLISTFKIISQENKENAKQEIFSTNKLRFIKCMLLNVCSVRLNRKREKIILKYILRININKELNRRNINTLYSLNAFIYSTCSCTFVNKRKLYVNIYLNKLRPFEQLVIDLKIFLKFLINNFCAKPPVDNMRCSLKVWKTFWQDILSSWRNLLYLNGKKVFHNFTSHKEKLKPNKILFGSLIKSLDLKKNFIDRVKGELAKSMKLCFLETFFSHFRKVSKFYGGELGKICSRRYYLFGRKSWMEALIYNSIFLKALIHIMPLDDAKYSQIECEIKSNIYITKQFIRNISRNIDKCIMNKRIQNRRLFDINLCAGTIYKDFSSNRRIKKSFLYYPYFKISDIYLTPKYIIIYTRLNFLKIRYIKCAHSHFSFLCIFCLNNFYFKTNFYSRLFLDLLILKEGAFKSYTFFLTQNGFAHFGTRIVCEREKIFIEKQKKIKERDQRQMKREEKDQQQRNQFSCKIFCRYKNAEYNENMEIKEVYKYKNLDCFPYQNINITKYRTSINIYLRNKNYKIGRTNLPLIVITNYLYKAKYPLLNYCPFIRNNFTIISYKDAYKILIKTNNNVLIYTCYLDNKLHPKCITGPISTSDFIKQSNTSLNGKTKIPKKGNFQRKFGSFGNSWKQNMEKGKSKNKLLSISLPRPKRSVKENSYKAFYPDKDIKENNGKYNVPSKLYNENLMVFNLYNSLPKLKYLPNLFTSKEIKFKSMSSNLRKKRSWYSNIKEIFAKYTNVSLLNLASFGFKNTTTFLSTKLNITSTNINNSNAHPRQLKSVSYAPIKRGIDTKIDIHILGLFDLTCEPGQHVGGYSERAAAQLAIKHVNQMEVIPGHRLVMITNDTKCDTGMGVDAFFHAVYTQKARLLLLLGPSCADVTESLAQVTPYWNLVQIAFGSETPALSDRSSYPLFFRTVAPDASHNPARVALLRHLNWHTVATLSESNNLYTLAVNELVLPLENANITLLATVTMDANDDFAEHLLALKEMDCRIFIGSFSPPLTRMLFCQIYHLKMYGRDYAWLLSGIPNNRWWLDTRGTNCTMSQLIQASEASFLITAHTFSVGSNHTISGMSSRDFSRIFATTRYPLTRYVTHTYDAVWAGALALKKITERYKSNSIETWITPTKKPDWGYWGMQKLLSKTFRNYESETHPRNVSLRHETSFKLKRNHIWDKNKAKWTKEGKTEKPRSPSNLIEFGYKSPVLTSDLLWELQHLQFNGVSGPVSFEGTDRIGLTAFYQIQDGEPRMVSLYYPETKFLDFKCPGCGTVKWPGGQVPIASRVFMTRIVTINPLAFIVMSSLACLGIFLAFSFLIFNLTYRRLKCIKLSSPHLNNITIVGCVFVYTAVLLLGLDYATLSSSEHLPLVCTCRAFLLSAGFSLAFGSMFTKTYRVHQIFTRSNSAGLIRNKLLQDTQLISLVVVLIIADVVLVSTWALVDPMKRELHNLTLQNSPFDRGVVYQPQIEVCQSTHQNSWLGALYVYKGLLVTVGAYMAWETRHVKIQALNDSQYIGMSVYNVVLTSVIVIATAHIIREKTTLSYVIVTTLIITSTTTTLCLLFIPKILSLIRNIEGDPVVESMGLKIQSKTRRFVTEDNREKFYRAEVRNRVYKREIVQLENELGRLSKSLEMLDKSSSSSPSSESSSSEKGNVGLEDDKTIQAKHKNHENYLKHNIHGAVKRLSKAKYLQGDDAAVRRAKRALQTRLLHRSLPSLIITPVRLPGDGAEDSESTQKSGVFLRDVADGGRAVPPSPHPLQRARIQRRKMPDNLNDNDISDECNSEKTFQLKIPCKRKKSESSGIIDLRYTLNFSTPLLNELSLSVSGKRTNRPRVSFSDVPITYDPSDLPIHTPEFSFPPLISNIPSSSSSSIHSSESSVSGSLIMLPPYPSSSVSCLEKSLENSEAFFSVISPPPNFTSTSYQTSLKIQSLKRHSVSQPSVASSFCSILKNDSTLRKTRPINSKTKISLPNRQLSRTPSPNLTKISPLSTDIKFETTSKDLKLNFECYTDREVVLSSLSEYQVNDLGVLCPVKMKHSFFPLKSLPSSSSSTNTNSAVKSKPNGKSKSKTTNPSPKKMNKKYITDKEHCRKYSSGSRTHKDKPE